MKVEFYNLGGFANSQLFRLQSRGGAWRYYRVLDNGSDDMPHRELSASCAKDRTEMAAKFFEAMMAAGAVSIDRETRKDYAPRRIRFRVEAKGGAYLHFDIDGDLPNCFGGTWNTRGAVFLDPALGFVNPHHFGKLGRHYSTFDVAVAVIVHDIERFAAGEGYLSHDDPRIVAMRDRYRERGWHWFGEAA